SAPQPKAPPEPVAQTPPQADPVAPDPPLSPAMAKARTELVTRLHTELQTQGIQTESDAQSGRIFLPQGLQFAYGSARLPVQGSGDLQRLAKALSKILPCVANAKTPQKPLCPQGTGGGKLDAILIDGFALPAPMGSPRFRYNWLLATSRALQTYVALTRMEPQLSQYTNGRNQSLFRITGHASRTSLAETRYPRRVEIRFRMANP
ncbi:MAG: hypothetical protein HQM02_12950, partial [Magnetococcales bacterium]|nr:hypothetical protein [Magnetococcales bacterium]